ncbi:CsbD family protein [Rhodovulum sp. PH10]|uniref:CsbD family protein n=1 Tax=Rhodovulum sp. PH10 TaxID=1187851 RepID=UPI00027C204B|nr:CsbD family protein [Rhodovulum sp. PH10]
MRKTLLLLAVAAPLLALSTGPSLALNWDQISGNWKQFSGKAQQQWGKLTNDDLTVAAGRRQELVGRIQERYGVTKEEADRQVDSWLNSLD